MKLKSSFKSFLFSTLSLAATQPALAVNYPWTNASNGTDASGSYHFYYQQEQLSGVLKKLTSTYNLKLNANGSLNPAILSKIVSGNFNVKTPTDLLNQLEVSYGFSWFYYSNTLYITSNQTTSAIVYVSPESMGNIKTILSKEDLLSDKFGWTEIPSESRVIVSGPKEYVNLVLARVHKLNVSPINQQFAIYKLKYASPVDTTINVGSQQIVIPGVATILQNIIVGKSNGSNMPSSSNKILDKIAEPLKNQAATSAVMAGLAGNANSSAGTGFQDTQSTVSAPLIQADSRLSAIIIRDKATNLKIYKSLIDMLDVPTPLVQVEAMIIDFDQSRMNQSGVSWWGTAAGVGGGYNADQLKSNSGFSVGSLSPSNLIVSNVGGFLAKLQFLEDNGLAKTESKSGIVTQDNIAAALNLTESFYSAPSSSSQSGNPGQVNTNMTMLITPHVIFDDNKNKIKLSVSLQDGNIEEKVVNNMPTTMQGSVNSQAVINAGQSLLIAGYSRVVSEKVTNQVPVLSSVPIVGWLFKNSTTKDRKFQRTYLITPRILWEGRNDETGNDVEETTSADTSKMFGALNSEPASTTTLNDSSDAQINATNKQIQQPKQVQQQPVNTTLATTSAPQQQQAQPQTKTITIDTPADNSTPVNQNSDAKSKENAQRFIDMISASAH